MSKEQRIMDVGLMFDYLEIIANGQEILMSPIQLGEMNKRCYFNFNEQAENCEWNLRAVHRYKYSMVLHRRFYDRICNEYDTAPPSKIIELFPEYFRGVSKDDFSSAKIPTTGCYYCESEILPTGMADILRLRSGAVSGSLLTSPWYVRWLNVLDIHHIKIKPDEKW